MEFKDFLDELNTLQDEREEFVERIKSHGLPVILYGAGIFAKSFTDALKVRGIEVAGYAVDDSYYTPNQTYLGRPVYLLSSLIESTDKYIFLYAVNKMTEENLNVSLRNFIYYPSISTGYDISYPTINRAYVLDNREKFSETFNLLEDDLSRKTFINFLKLKITGNCFWNFDVCHPDEYFNELTMPTAKVNWGVFGLRSLSRR